jgi:hypothetical protein
MSIFFRKPSEIIWHFRLKFDEKKAKTYLLDNGILNIIPIGEKEEFPPNFYDLYFLHRTIRTRRPKVILEFGLGFSTIVMSHALYQNDQDLIRAGKPLGQKSKLFSIDTNKKWIENTGKKLEDPLKEYVELIQSDSEISIWEGELCHFYNQLPDIVPHFVYLDGPSPAEIKGSIRGIRFPKSTGPNRSVVAADLLLYESTVKPSFYIVVDGRYQNVQFLKRHLKRRYRFKRDKFHNISVFELLE